MHFLFDRSFAPVVLLIALSCLAGCRREIELTYTSSEEVLDLPDEDQANIRLLLAKFYGTPSDPTLRVLVEDAEYQPPDEDDSDTDPFPFVLEEKLDTDHLKMGALVYHQRCASCHGVTGDGNGPAAEYLDPEPRDYRKGVFKFTSTGRSKPRKADLIRTVKYGAKGTSMPSFRWLDEREMSAVVDYVIVLSQRGETEQKLIILSEDEELEYAAEDALAVYESWTEAPAKLIQPKTPPPPKTEEAILSGRHEFLVKGCAKCHGANAQGFTTFPMQDDWGNQLYAANLTSGMLHGGRREIDVYRRIYSGINGTPMPAFGPEFSPAYTNDPEKIWHLTYYVLALADGRQFPYVSDEEATRMAAEELSPNTPMPDPMPEVETPMPDEDEPSEDSADETGEDVQDPREANPQPPVVEEPEPVPAS